MRKPNKPAAGEAGITRLLTIERHCPACLSRVVEHTTML